MAIDAPKTCWSFNQFRWTVADWPIVMGIVNVTPDSFSDGGQFYSVEAAVDRGQALVEEGAGILDIGGESTRPGAALVSEAEELRRVIPVIERLAAKTSVPISIDTSKAEVAKQALRAGAAVVNDISGLRFDPKMIDVCAESTCGVVCMHIQGTPQTMQLDPHYDDVVKEVHEEFAARLRVLVSRGIAPERIVFDPGIGFGKTAQHNVDLLANLNALRVESRPLLIGHSRKRFLQKIIGRSVDERLFGTVGVSVAVAAQGAEIIRVHDVAASRDAIVTFRAIEAARRH